MVLLRKKKNMKMRDPKLSEQEPIGEVDVEIYDPIEEQTHCQKYFYVYLLCTITTIILVAIGFGYYMYRRVKVYGIYYGLTFEEPPITTTTISPTTTPTTYRRPWQTYYGFSSASCLGLSHYVLAVLILILVN